MNDMIRNGMEALERVKQFALDNPADFATGIPHAKLLITNGGLASMIGFAADQAEGGGDASAAYVVKDLTREALSEIMHKIARIARMMEYQYPGISERYHIPRNRSDQEMLATARSWDVQLGQNSDELHFKNYGMPDDFRTVLNDNADAFEASFGATASGVGDRVAATALLGETFRNSMVALRILDAVMQNIYESSPGKLAAWKTAAHVEKS